MVTKVQKTRFNQVYAHSSKTEQFNKVYAHSSKTEQLAIHTHTGQTD